MGAAVAAWVFSPKGDNQTYAPVFLPYLTLPYLPCPPLRHLCLYDLANKLTLTVFGPQTLAKHAHSLDCELLFDVGYVSFPFLSLFCVCACGKIDMADIFYFSYYVPGAVASAYCAEEGGYSTRPRAAVVLPGTMDGICRELVRLVMA